MKNAFVVDEPTGARWELALDLLRRGKGFSIGPVAFRRADSTVVEAAVTSTWQFERVTAARARADLEQARQWTEDLLASDDGFSDAIAGSTVDYVLIDDYGNGAVAICRLVGDDVRWMTPNGQPPVG
jgi:hypothetical protein